MYKIIIKLYNSRKAYFSKKRTVRDDGVNLIIITVQN
jgi:hypothetical protein